MIHNTIEHSRGELLLTDPSIVDSNAMPPKKRGLSAFDKRWRKMSRKASWRFAGFSTLTGSMGTTFSWNAQVALTGVAYTPSTNSSSIIKRQPFGTTQGSNTQSGGCDECFSYQQGVVAGGSVTVNVYNGMTDLLQRANTQLARIKGTQLRVLSAEDDPTISPTPTATSVGVVLNTVAANPVALDFGANGSGLTLALTQSGGALTGVSIGAAGTHYPKSTSFLVAPVQNGGSGGTVFVITDGSGVPTTVGVANPGAGYSNATVPTVVAGQYSILTGGTHMYFDPSATGFCIPSSTQKNFTLQNTDGSNAITFEVDFFAATS